MSPLHGLPYERIIRVLKKAGRIVFLQRGNHVRLQKCTENETGKITIPVIAPADT